jgi:hypothetical protein
MLEFLPRNPGPGEATAEGSEMMTQRFEPERD